jgi:type III secretion protein V
VFEALGVNVPLARLSKSEDALGRSYSIDIAGVPVHREEVSSEIADSGISAHLHQTLELLLKRNAKEFLGIQETQQMLDLAEKRIPALVREVVPKLMSVQLLTDVLRRLVEEQVSIRDLRTVLGALADWARAEKDPVLLTEHVRGALRRWLTHELAKGSDTLPVLLLDPLVEDTIRGAVQRLPTGSYLALDPETSQDLVAAIRGEVAARPELERPVILTTLEIRRFVKRLCEVDLPDLAVVSYQELAPELQIQPLGRIRVGA